MANPEQPQSNSSEFAHRLEQAKNDAERTAIWNEYLQVRTDQLAEDTGTAQELMTGGDLNGLRSHLSRYSRDRAAAHVADIHPVQSGNNDLPPAAL